VSRDDVMTTCFTQLSHKKKEEVSCDQTEGERKQVAPIFSFVSFPRLLSSFPSLSFASLSTPMTDKSFSSGGQTFRTRIGNLLLKNTPPPLLRPAPHTTHILSKHHFYLWPAHSLPLTLLQPSTITLAFHHVEDFEVRLFPSGEIKHRPACVFTHALSVSAHALDFGSSYIPMLQSSHSNTFVSSCFHLGINSVFHTSMKLSN